MWWIAWWPIKNKACFAVEPRIGPIAAHAFHTPFPVERHPSTICIGGATGKL